MFILIIIINFIAKLHFRYDMIKKDLYIYQILLYVFVVFLLLSVCSNYLSQLKEHSSVNGAKFNNFCEFFLKQWYY